MIARVRPELTAADVAWLLGQARRRWRGHDAEDIAQEACLRVCQALDRYRPGNWRGWLRSILRNVGIDHDRRRRMRREHAVIPEPEGVDPGPTLAVDLGPVLARLPVIYHRVMELRAVGLSNPEIAARLGLPVGTVFSRLHRARRALVIREAELREELA